MEEFCEHLKFLKVGKGKGRKGNIRENFYMEDSVFEKKKVNAVWNENEVGGCGVFFQYFGVKNQARSMDMR